MPKDSLSALDKKLDKVLDFFAESYHPEHEYNASYANQNTKERVATIGTIKLYFKDAGYIQVPHAEVTKDGALQVSSDKGVEYKGIPLMTGKDWYKRFNDETLLTVEQVHVLSLLSEKDSVEYVLNEIRAAAKRASGIGEETK